jgi:glycopeptide antibiotics resistance protein
MIFSRTQFASPVINKSLFLSQANWLKVLCIITIAAILIATLWPFNFFFRNVVNWLPNANGIRFGRDGIVVSETSLPAPGADLSKSWSLEIILRPETVEGAHTILSVYVHDNPWPFKVRQYDDGLLVSHNPGGVATKARTKFDVDHVFQEGKIAFLTLTSRPNGTIVYLNGKQAQAFPKFTISQNDLAGQIVMGTSPSDYDPWPGEVRGLAIYSKELTPTEVVRHFLNWTDEGASALSDLSGAIALYSFNERSGGLIQSSIVSAPTLKIPDRFSIPHKAFLRPPWKDFEISWDYADDVLRNIAGFVPLGFLLCAYWSVTRPPQRALLYTIIAGGLLSLMIEVLQFFIPQRNSGITDIITNTLGTALGAIIAISAIGQMIIGTRKPISK